MSWTAAVVVAGICLALAGQADGQEAPPAAAPPGGGGENGGRRICAGAP
jgi:hypothetical protein